MPIYNIKCLIWPWELLYSNPLHYKKNKECLIFAWTYFIKKSKCTSKNVTNNINLKHEGINKTYPIPFTYKIVRWKYERWHKFKWVELVKICWRQSTYKTVNGHTSPIPLSTFLLLTGNIVFSLTWRFFTLQKPAWKFPRLANESVRQVGQILTLSHKYIALSTLCSFSQFGFNLLVV